MPSTPEALESTFVASRYGRDLHDSLEKYKVSQAQEAHDQEAFRAAVAAQKKKGVSHKSPYTLGFAGQVAALTKRQFRLRLQDRFQLITSYGLNWVSTDLPGLLNQLVHIRLRLNLDFGDHNWCCFLQPSPHLGWRFHQRKCHLCW